LHGFGRPLKIRRRIIGDRATDDEWYKAAYNQPAAQGGDSDDWWLYPTASNTLAGNEDLDGANDFDGDFLGGQSFNSGPFSPVGWYTEAPRSPTFFEVRREPSQRVESSRRRSCLEKSGIRS